MTIYVFGTFSLNYFFIPLFPFVYLIYCFDSYLPSKCLVVYHQLLDATTFEVRYDSLNDLTKFDILQYYTVGCEGDVVKFAFFPISYSRMDSRILRFLANSILSIYFVLLWDLFSIYSRDTTFIALISIANISTAIYY